MTRTAAAGLGAPPAIKPPAAVAPVRGAPSPPSAGSSPAPPARARAGPPSFPSHRSSSPRTACSPTSRAFKSRPAGCEAVHLGPRPAAGHSKSRARAALWRRIERRRRGSSPRGRAVRRGRSGGVAGGAPRGAPGPGPRRRRWTLDGVGAAGARARAAWRGRRARSVGRLRAGHSNSRARVRGVRSHACDPTPRPPPARSAARVGPFDGRRRAGISPAPPRRGGGRGGRARRPRAPTTTTRRSESSVEAAAAPWSRPCLRVRLVALRRFRSTAPPRSGTRFRGAPLARLQHRAGGRRQARPCRRCRLRFAEGLRGAADPRVDRPRTSRTALDGPSRARARGGARGSRARRPSGRLTFGGAHAAVLQRVLGDLLRPVPGAACAAWDGARTCGCAARATRGPGTRGPRVRRRGRPATRDPGTRSARGGGTGARTSSASTTSSCRAERAASA